jgi:acetyl-CoA carboxylase carboxyl transferase subunit alpha
MQEINKDAFEKVQLARNPKRPYTNDLLKSIFTDFVELHGDRRYSDDAAIVAGFAKIDGIDAAVIGQQKGRDTNQRRRRNFGMPKPEGYRKALRIMRLAEKFGRPVITFIDTPGAYPGIDAEERGQAEAIAFNLREMASLKVPTVVVVLGEGGSGGALAIGVGDRVLMLENAVYSVISPEGCAAILWKDAAQANLAAESLRLTAEDLQKFELIDGIIPEKKEWVYSESENSNDLDPVTERIKEQIVKNLKELTAMTGNELLSVRYKKFRQMGNWSDRLTKSNI